MADIAGLFAPQRVFHLRTANLADSRGSSCARRASRGRLGSAGLGKEPRR